MRGSRLLLAGTATAVGAALGWAVARHKVERSRGSLFHALPRRRLAALAALETRATTDTLHVLRDYLSWERQPMLRRRATRLLRRLEGRLA